MTDDHCPSQDFKICDNNACKACSAILPCPSPYVCDVGLGRCEECLSTPDCTSDLQKPICETGTRLCRACTNGECTAPLFCNTNSGACVECVDNTDCTNINEPICENGFCEACNNNCPPGLVCQLGTGRCVDCLDSSHCSGTTPVCDSNDCVPCVDNPTDTCPGLRNCDTLTGECVDCVNNGDCNSNSAIPICRSRVCSPC